MFGRSLATIGIWASVAVVAILRADNTAEIIIGMAMCAAAGTFFVWLEA